jgi:flavin reductase (DIM6/NTAB) family NADH-FMN oxidoreductase RutF
MVPGRGSGGGRIGGVRWAWMALDDELLNRVTWKIPNALALVGSRSGDERNGMTTSWITQLSMDPVLIGVGVDNSAVTHRLISEGGSFSVNLWDSDDTRVFVKFSKPAQYEDGALNGRPVHEVATGAPVFDEAIAWMDCEVRHTVDLGTHTLFVGEVVAAEVRDDAARPASMHDTRMKYGGVKRH